MLIIPCHRERGLGGVHEIMSGFGVVNQMLLSGLADNKGSRGCMAKWGGCLPRVRTCVCAGLSPAVHIRFVEVAAPRCHSWGLRVRAVG